MWTKALRPAARLCIWLVSTECETISDHGGVEEQQCTATCQGGMWLFSANYGQPAISAFYHRALIALVLIFSLVEVEYSHSWVHATIITDAEKVYAFRESSCQVAARPSRIDSPTGALVAPGRRKSHGAPTERGAAITISQYSNQNSAPWPGLPSVLKSLSCDSTTKLVTGG